MTDVRTLLILTVLSALLLGCPSEEEEDSFPLEMCEVMAGGEVTDLTAAADLEAAPDLTITEDHADGHVNTIAGLSDAEATYVAFTPDEDGELVLFADVADVVVALLEDGVDIGLGAASPNAECEDEIPDHWHLEDLTAGTAYALALGLTTATEIHLVLAHHEGEHEHEE
jgi:hypothetical protein